MLEQAFHQGVPNQLKTEVWSLIMPNTTKINKKLYKVLLDRVNISTENSEKDIHFKKHLKVIEEDLHRTYSELALFRYGQKLYQPLKNVLLAYSLLRPDVGYVQGMSYVAASLMLHLGSEIETLTVFSNLMQREDMIHDFYSFEMERVNIVFHIFIRLMKDKLPNLYEVFQQTGLSCSIFLFEWVVALYSNIFSPSVSSRIWDNLFYYGEFYIIKTGLAICHCLDQQVSDGSFEMVVIMIKNVK